MQKKSEINLPNDGDEIEERTLLTMISLWKQKPSMKLNASWLCVFVLPHFISFSRFLSLLSLPLILVRSFHHPFEISIHMSLQNFEFTTSQCSLFFLSSVFSKAFGIDWRYPNVSRNTHLYENLEKQHIVQPFDTCPCLKVFHAKLIFLKLFVNACHIQHIPIQTNFCPVHGIWWRSHSNDVLKVSGKHGS